MRVQKRSKRSTAGGIWYNQLKNQLGRWRLRSASVTLTRSTCARLRDISRLICKSWHAIKRRRWSRLFAINSHSGVRFFSSWLIFHLWFHFHQQVSSGGSSQQLRPAYLCGFPHLCAFQHECPGMTVTVHLWRVNELFFQSQSLMQFFSYFYLLVNWGLLHEAAEINNL